MKKTFEVQLSSVEYANIQIEAESADEAEDIAFEMFIHNEIDFSDSGIPGDINVTVTEIKPTPDNILIFWGDLTHEKQDEILEAFGDNCNYDMIPIVEIPVFQEET